MGLETSSDQFKQEFITEFSETLSFAASSESDCANKSIKQPGSFAGHKRFTRQAACLDTQEARRKLDMPLAKRVINPRRGKTLMPNAANESPLVRRAKKLFSEPSPQTVFLRDVYPAFADEPQIVQSYTTYSLGDVPLFIPPPQK